MEFTFDHFIIILGILLGVGFTLIGIRFMEYLKNRRGKIQLTTAFKNEVLINLNKTIFNLLLYDALHKERKGARLLFYTTAYEQLKLKILLDWTESKLASHIYDGFSYAEEYNKRINKPELYKKEMGSEKVVLEKIKKNMFAIDQALKNCKNIETALNEDC